MPAKFDKKAYAQQIDALDLESIQDQISAIDERTYTDLHKREVLVERRKVLAAPLFDGQTQVKLEHWVFELRQQKKPSSKAIIAVSSLDRFKGIWDCIVDESADQLSISRKALEEILEKLNMSEQDKEDFLKAVLVNAEPSITAKRI